MTDQKEEKKTITAAELDKKFDDGEEDILEYFDLTNIRCPNREKSQPTAGQ